MAGLFDPNPWDDEESNPLTLALAEAERQSEQSSGDDDRYGGPSPADRAAMDAAATRAASEAHREASGPRWEFGPKGMTLQRNRRSDDPPDEPSPKPAQQPGRKIARDGQTIYQQSYWTQTSFRHAYGERAEEEWVRQHEAELDKNQRLYGAQDPKAGATPVAGAPSGTPTAPDRRIGAVPPPQAAATAGAQTVPGPTGAPPSAAPTPPTQAPGQPSTALPGRPQAATPSSAASPTKRAGVESLPIGTRRGRWSNGPSGEYFVTPDGTLYSRHADGSFVSIGVNPDEYQQGTPLAAPPQATPVAQQAADTQRMSQTTSTDPISQVRPGERPIDAVLRLSGKPPDQSKTILQGIGALLRGDASGAWAEPYLNDAARLAWARENQAQGRNVDPRDTPAEYIESWKDAFFGSDHSVPLVKELDQQMIDAEVDRAAVEQRPFDWRNIYGETGENGLISTQIASNDCGPNVAAIVLRSRGYNVDPDQMFEYAKRKGYHDGEQFTGPYNMARMLREEAGVDASAHPLDWSVVDAELDAGRPVILSSGGHYWAVSAYRDGPVGREYFAGATASVVSNPEWATPGAFRYGGAPNVMVLARGDVRPDAPVIATFGLKPPTGSAPDRSLLSMSTRSQQAATPAPQPDNLATRRMTAQVSAAPQGLNDWSKIAWDLSIEEGVDDPVMIQAIMGQESGGDPNTPDSYAGARGPMQLMPAAAAEVGVNRDDPVDNTRGGIRYMKRMLERYGGNLDLALAAYNAGPGAVDQYGGIPPFEETQRYVRAVKARYAALNEAYGRMR